MKEFIMPETFDNWQQRSEILLGESAIKKLRRSRILLAGAGGVGGYAAEALIRSGIGYLSVYDPDTIHPTNLNRQILALHSSNGTPKASALSQRLMDINPQLELKAHFTALTPENIPEILSSENWDYVVDAIDSLEDKCCLLAESFRRNIPIISAMGAGCRIHPELVQYADISKTFGCPLAKAVRQRLRRDYNISRGIECVFSSESNSMAVQPGSPGERPVIGSSSFMPGIVGLFLAARVINNLAV